MAFLLNEYKSLEVNFDAWEAELFRFYMDALFQTEIQRIPADYARNKHRWKNRTGQAHSKIRAYVSTGRELNLPDLGNDGAYLVVGFDPVEHRKTGPRHYAVYLETIQQGRFAILDEALIATGEQIFQAIGDYVFNEAKAAGMI